jgi:hypothetical protein
MYLLGRRLLLHKRAKYAWDKTAYKKLKYWISHGRTRIFWMIM